MIKAVIFDMDGLMIDSEPFHYEAFNEIFKKFGKELPQEDNNTYFVGISDDDAAPKMIEKYNLPIEPKDLVREKQVVFQELIKNITPQPGLMELLNTLQEKGYKKAIASSTALDDIEIIISALGITRYLDGYFSAQQVLHGKPAPDLFLYAAEKLGVQPKECVVLEDAPAGITAAKAAGMVRYAIPSRETKGKDFSSATKVLASLHEVFENLQKEK